MEAEVWPKRLWYLAESPWPERAARSRASTGRGRDKVGGQPKPGAGRGRSWRCGKLVQEFQMSVFKAARIQRAAPAAVASFGWRSSRRAAAFFASMSASSFPITPAWPGTQSTCAWPARAMSSMLRGRVAQLSRSSAAAWRFFWDDLPVPRWALSTTAALSRHAHKLFAAQAARWVVAACRPRAKAEASASKTSAYWPQGVCSDAILCSPR